MKQLTNSILDELAVKAQQSPRLRTNYNLHESLGDPIQRLANAMEPDTLVLPHRHSHTWELLLSLRGRFVVLLFDDDGKVAERVLLGDDCNVLEFPANTWHAMLSLDTGGVFFEVKQGPYMPISDADIAPWVKGADQAALNGWYAKARVGDTFVD